MWRRKWKQHASNTIGRRWRPSRATTELDEEEWSVSCAVWGVTRLNEERKNTPLGQLTRIIRYACLYCSAGMNQSTIYAGIQVCLNPSQLQSHTHTLFLR